MEKSPAAVSLRNQEMSIREIAEELEIPKTTVERWLQRGSDCVQLHPFLFLSLSPLGWCAIPSFRSFFRQLLIVARCEDGVATESAIHRHLKSEDRKINSPGNQWCLTNAHEVNALFREFRDA